MRTLTFLALTALLAGCSSKTDGVWLVTMTLVADDCSDDPVLGTEATAVMDIYETTENTLVIDLGGDLIPGTRDGSAFTAEIVDGVRYSDPECDRYEEQSTFTLTGEFTKDLGITGTASLVYSATVDSCPQAGDDDQETCRRTYQMTGLKMTGHHEDYPRDGFSWGYAGGY